MMLTIRQRNDLRRVAALPLGVIEWPGPRGLAYASWDKGMRRLVREGLFTPYVHGGYEITEAGRARAAELEA